MVNPTMKMYGYPVQDILRVCSSLETLVHEDQTLASVIFREGGVGQVRTAANKVRVLQDELSRMGVSFQVTDVPVAAPVQPALTPPLPRVKSNATPVSVVATKEGAEILAFLKGKPRGEDLAYLAKKFGFKENLLLKFFKGVAQRGGVTVAKAGYYGGGYRIREVPNTKKAVTEVKSESPQKARPVPASDETVRTFLAGHPNGVNIKDLATHFGFLRKGSVDTKKMNPFLSTLTEKGVIFIRKDYRHWNNSKVVLAITPAPSADPAMREPTNAEIVAFVGESLHGVGAKTVADHFQHNTLLMASRLSQLEIQGKLRCLPDERDQGYMVYRMVLPTPPVAVEPLDPPSPIPWEGKAREKMASLEEKVVDHLRRFPEGVGIEKLAAWFETTLEAMRETLFKMEEKNVVVADSLHDKEEKKTRLVYRVRTGQPQPPPAVPSPSPVKAPVAPLAKEEPVPYSEQLFSVLSDSPGGIRLVDIGPLLGISYAQGIRAARTLRDHKRAYNKEGYIVLGAPKDDEESRVEALNAFLRGKPRGALFADIRKALGLPSVWVWNRLQSKNYSYKNRKGPGRKQRLYFLNT